METTMVSHNRANEVPITLNKKYEYSAHGSPLGVGLRLLGFIIGFVLKLLPKLSKQNV